MDVSRFVCVAALGVPEGIPISVTGFGNINPIPFHPKGCCFLAFASITHFRKAFANDLGSTNPHATAVHVEPFSTSVFKVLT